MQNCRPPSFFLTNSTTLDQALWLGWMAPASNISHRLFQTSSNNSRGICLNHSLKGVSSFTFIMCSVEWVQPNSAGSNENTWWYLAMSQQAASANLGAQEPKPLKSNSSNNLPCLCPTVSLGGMGTLGLIYPSCNWASLGGSSTGNATTALATGFSFRGSGSKLYCSLPTQLHFYFLVSIWYMCSVQ